MIRVFTLVASLLGVGLLLGFSETSRRAANGGADSRDPVKKADQPKPITKDDLPAAETKLADLEKTIAAKEKELANLKAEADLLLSAIDKAKNPDGKVVRSAAELEKADRQRVLACGFTEAEADCWIYLNRAAGKFLALPKLHPADDQELAQAIHVLQYRLLSRPAYRKYKELAKDQMK